MIIRRLAARDPVALAAAVHQHVNAITDHMTELHDRVSDSYVVD